MVGNAAYAQAVQSLWDGRCSVYVRSAVTDPATGRETMTETPIYCGLPCRISFETVTATEPSDNAHKTVQSIKLFIDHAMNIPPGSKITVTQNGVTDTYEQSGVAAVYSSHKEITLERFKGWA